MAEPTTTWAGYKAGTLISALLGASVTAGITPGPLHMRIIAGASGAATALIATPVMAPVAIKMFEIMYGWIGIPASGVPSEGVTGMTGFFLALVGIDVCRWAIDTTRKILSKLPLRWPGSRL